MASEITLRCSLRNNSAVTVPLALGSSARANFELGSTGQL
jgi:hypothetical protein